MVDNTRYAVNSTPLMESFNFNIDLFCVKKIGEVDVEI